MSGLSNQAAAAIAAKAIGLSIVDGASPQPPNAIPPITQGKVYVVVDGPRIHNVGGSWQERTYTFTLHVLIERPGDAAAEQAQINDAADLFLDAWVNGGALGGVVTFSEMGDVDTTKFYEVGGSTYQSADCELLATVETPQTYTA